MKDITPFGSDLINKSNKEENLNISLPFNDERFSREKITILTNERTESGKYFIEKILELSGSYRGYVELDIYSTEPRKLEDFGVTVKDEASLDLDKLGEGDFLILAGLDLSVSNAILESHYDIETICIDELDSPSIQYALDTIEDWLKNKEEIDYGKEINLYSDFISTPEGLMKMTPYRESDKEEPRTIEIKGHLSLNELTMTKREVEEVIGGFLETFILDQPNTEDSDPWKSIEKLGYVDDLDLSNIMEKIEVIKESYIKEYFSKKYDNDYEAVTRLSKCIDNPTDLTKFNKILQRRLNVNGFFGIDEENKNNSNNNIFMIFEDYLL